MKAFLDRPLEGDWPNLWLDATYLKVREGGRIVSVAAIIAVAANTKGRREIVGLGVGPSEAEAFLGGLPEATDQTRPARRARRAEGRRPAGRRRYMATLPRILHGGRDNRLVRLTSLFSRSSGFVECIFVRCSGAKVM